MEFLNLDKPTPKRSEAPNSVLSEPVPNPKQPNRPTPDNKKIPTPKSPRSKKKVITVIGVGIVLVVAIVSIITKSNSPNEAILAPDYRTITPIGKTINELGGWQRVSPLKSDPVFAYTDSINGATISVSEQPIPRTFIEDVELGVSNLAKQYNATDTLTVGAVKVYIGTSSIGPQSVIFTKSNLLILIKSKTVISNDDWVKYIASLR